jgi:uncharacterized secreted repeat protein (TIGR03808 family)
MLRSNFPGDDLSRRGLLRLCCAVSLSSVYTNPQARARAVDIARDLREAARRGAAVNLPAGEITIGGLDLPDDAILRGVAGRTVLKLAGAGPLLSGAMARRISLESLIFDGAAGHVPRDRGLLDFSDVVDLSIRGCVIRNSTARGLNLIRCGGAVSQTRIEGIGDAACHMLDGLGLDFDGNHIRDCGDNGVSVWASVAGRYDGARLRNNLIEDVRNRSGGNGPFGNGIVVFGAAGLRIERNRILRCAYTAVRINNGRDTLVLGNDCRGFGEKAMYAEFGAKNTVFRDNRIEDAGAGIAVANAEKGTEGAIVSGNRIIRMRESRPDPEFGPEMFWLTGILAEKNADVSGNAIVGPGWIGVMLGGWRENLRAEGNDISNVDYGVAFATGEGTGEATIVRNRIRAQKSAVIAMAGATVVPGDLTTPGARRYQRVSVRDNETG